MKIELANGYKTDPETAAGIWLNHTQHNAVELGEEIANAFCNPPMTVATIEAGTTRHNPHHAASLLTDIPA